MHVLISKNYKYVIGQEVVDSRVGNRVGTLIAYYSYDSLQINVFIIWNMYKIM